MDNYSHKKTIGLLSATALGVSAMIGSGWLFAPYQAAAVAGPGSLFSWILAAVIICLLGLCFAEIAALYPRRGLSAIIPTLSHNKHFAFPFAIANWLGIVAVIALESDATTQYLINLAPSIKPMLYNGTDLSLIGITFSVGLVLLFSTMNYWGISTFIKANNLFAGLKVIVPVIIGVAILLAAFHPENFYTVNDSIMPYGASSVVGAILSTGIIVAFNGFQTAISFASEIKRPCRTIPLAVTLAIAISLAIYLLLEVAFIGAIPSDMVTVSWHSLGFNAPVLQLLGIIGLGFLSSLAYFGSTLAPVGSGIIFTGTATRMFTAMSRNGQMPSYFKYMNPVYSVSRRSLVLNTILAILFLTLFPSWSRLAEVLSLFHVISYLPVPIALWVLRNKISAPKYTFRLPMGKAIAFFVFVFFTYLFTLAELDVVTYMMGIFAACLAIFILVTSRSLRDFIDVYKEVWSLLLYFLVLYILTAFSPLHSELFTEVQFIGVVVIVSACLFFLLLVSARDDVEIIESAVNMYK